jgi:glycosyltransferase involved in cell wall biosynthesis
VEVTLLVDALGPQVSGIGRYVAELCARIPLQPGIGRVGYFLHGRYFDEIEPLMEGSLPRQRRRMPKWFRRKLNERELGRGVIHGPNYFLPREAENGLITIHDLSIFRYPETHPLDRLRAFEREFANSLARASHVITDSETVRREVIAEFGLPNSRVTAVPLGVAEDFRPRERAEIEAELTALGLQPGGYGLCVSTLEPRKRIAELIRVWSALPPNIRNSTPLVLAGAKGWLNDELHAEIREGVSAGWLRHLGYVPDPVLLALYSGAVLFIYPSTYEGFGLPPLEAMASGVPVLVANRSCLPEICGDAAGYLDPDDVSAFTEAIVRALTDEHWRAEARQRGLERAAAFTWDRCVTATVNIYGSVSR